MKMSLLFCTYIFSFFYIIFLCILYFSKGRIDNNENKIYKKLLIANLIGIIIQIICDIVPVFRNEYIDCVAAKFLLAYFDIWIVLFFLYVLEISGLNTKKIKNTNFVIILI